MVETATAETLCEFLVQQFPQLKPRRPGTVDWREGGLAEWEEEILVDCDEPVKEEALLSVIPGFYRDRSFEAKVETGFVSLEKDDRWLIVNCTVFENEIRISVR